MSRLEQVNQTPYTDEVYQIWPEEEIIEHDFIDPLNCHCFPRADLFPGDEETSSVMVIEHMRKQ